MHDPQDVQVLLGTEIDALQAHKTYPTEVSHATVAAINLFDGARTVEHHEFAVCPSWCFDGDLSEGTADSGGNAHRRGRCPPPGLLKGMRTWHVLILVGALLTLFGCATIRRHEAPSTERLLAEAGFQMQPADTPEKIQGPSAILPLEIIGRRRGYEVTYTFADPYRCGCIYVGGPKEYSAYQHLLADETIRQAKAKSVRRSRWDR